ncbi:MAG TPA: DUF2249 domain-containing protein [Longimicrobiales bacterium]|nr:DUF2249 domain-containing protein [Longimicrobiales bacterium]
MVIRKSDRVATVLKADESLIDVFVGLSPAFERLRNPAMRKVMARLVTVEQAARMAGVDADTLVARLNGARPDADAPAPGGSEPPTSHAAYAPRTPPAEAPRTAPAELERIPGALRVEVDVREDLRSGREPFSRIMAARRQVPPGGALRVRAIFEPVPLYAVMEKQGFDHFTEQLGPEDWSVWFYPADSNGQREPSGARVSAEPAAAVAAEDAADDDSGEGVVVLDVRGLEPPEPMMRTLSALESLPPGGTLVQLNVRVPQFLLPQLEERGFVYEIREQRPDLVRVIIHRAR